MMRETAVYSPREGKFEENISKLACPLGLGGDHLTHLPTLSRTRSAFVDLCRNSNKNAVSIAVWNRTFEVLSRDFICGTR